MQDLIRQLLIELGENPDREGLRETPQRVARMYAELFAGLHEDPRVHLQKFFVEQYDEVVLVRDISFNSMCEHHMLPFTGLAHIGYVPDGRVIGFLRVTATGRSSLRACTVEQEQPPPAAREILP